MRYKGRGIASLCLDIANRARLANCSIVDKCPYRTALGFLKCRANQRLQFLQAFFFLSTTVCHIMKVNQTSWMAAHLPSFVYCCECCAHSILVSSYPVLPAKINCNTLILNSSFIFLISNYVLGHTGLHMKLILYSRNVFYIFLSLSLYII